MCKERRKKIKSGHGSLDGVFFSLINYDVIPWGGGQNVNAIGINSSEWKGMKENQECTSGDYSQTTLSPLKPLDLLLLKNVQFLNGQLL